jgi:hypothetical protein
MARLELTIPESKKLMLIDFLKDFPATLGELREERFVRRKIGVGYLLPMLLSLLSEGKIARTNGIFWAMPTTTKVGQ